MTDRAPVLRELLALAYRGNAGEIPVAAMAESCRLLLDPLGDEQLKHIAVWKMEGHSNQEIADRLGCVVETVEGRLRLIRSLWQREMRSDWRVIPAAVR